MPHNQDSTPSSNQTALEAINSDRTTVIQLLGLLDKYLQDLDLPRQRQEIQELRVQLERATFKVLILGEFNRGKSTLINALLGAKVLPTQARPTTAILSILRWGDKPQAVVYPLSAPGGSAPAHTIPIDKLEDYIAIRGDSRRYTNAYDRVEIYWPLDLLRNYVELIDSPGLNENLERENHSLSYLTAVDAVVYTINATEPITSQDLLVLQKIRSRVSTNIFFVCTMFDKVKQHELADVEARITYEIEPFKGAQRVDDMLFFIDARTALEGKINRKADFLTRSGILPLEAALKNYLGGTPGRYKVVLRTHQARSIIEEAQLSIAERLRFFDAEIPDLQARLEQLRARQSAMNKDRALLFNRLTTIRTRLQTLLYNESRRFFIGIAEKVQEWLENYESSNPLKFWDNFDQTRRTQLQEEYSNYVGTKVEQSYKRWLEMVLMPQIVDKLNEEVFDDLRELLFQIRKNLDEAQRELDANSGDQNTGLRVQRSLGEQSGGIRPPTQNQPINQFMDGMLSGAIDQSLDIFISALLTGNISVSSSRQLALALGLLFFTPLGPVSIVTILIGSVFVESAFGASKVSNVIRDTVIGGYQRALQGDAGEEQSEKITTAFLRDFDMLQQRLDTALGKEIDGLSQEITRAIAAKQRGQADIEAQRRLFDKVGTELVLIDRQLQGILSHWQ